MEVYLITEQNGTPRITERNKISESRNVVQAVMLEIDVHWDWNVNFLALMSLLGLLIRRFGAIFSFVVKGHFEENYIQRPHTCHKVCHMTPQNFQHDMQKVNINKS